MITRLFRKYAPIGVVILVSLALIGQTALAGQNANNNPTNQELIITEVSVDFNNSTITIKGVNFDNGATPVVTLGDDPTPLSLVSSTATEIVADLPGISDGDYLLTVSTGPSVITYDEYDLTIGAVGPQGPQGEKGDMGTLYTRNCANSQQCSCDDSNDQAIGGYADCSFSDGDRPLCAAGVIGTGTYQGLCCTCETSPDGIVCIYSSPSVISVLCIEVP